MTSAIALPDQNEWTQIKEISQMAVQSGLLPAAIKTKEQAAIIALKGRELGLPPMVAFAHINVIQGKPSMSAEIMLAYIYKDHPAAEIHIAERTATKCVIKARRPNEKEASVFTWDMDRARRMGLDQKDNWKKQPETMLFWRAITEMKRAKFPEVLMGIDYSPEELGASVDEKGEIKDVGPKIDPDKAQPEVKHIKNYAPQAPVKTATQDQVDKILEEVSEPTVSREELSKLVAKEQRRLKWKPADLIGFVNVHFKKQPKELSDDEMQFLVSLLEAIEEGAA